MSIGRIKSEWGAVRFVDGGGVVLATKDKDLIMCFSFASSEEFRQAIDTKRISVKKWAVSLSNENCIFKTVEMPAENIAEAYRMAEFELSTLVPVPSEELVYGCTLLGSEESLCEVLVCVVKTESLNRALEPYHTMGIHPVKVVPEAIALSCWFDGASKQVNNDVINLYVDGVSLHVNITLGGRFVGFKKANKFTEGGGLTLKTVVAEIIHAKSDLGTFLSERPAINVGVAGKHKDAVQNIFDDMVNQEDIRFLDLPQISSLNEEGVSEVEEFAYDAVAVEGLMSCIADSEYEYLNLVPGRRIRAAFERTQMMNYAVSIGLVFFLVFSIWLNLMMFNWRTGRACRKLQAEIAPIAHIAEAVEAKRHRVRAIQTQLSNRRQISLLFYELYKYSPQLISVSELNYAVDSGGTRITMRGQADSIANAFAYSEAMKDGKLLNEL
ncbi:hypothetical protein KAR91_23990 [Candidatus Pacearchaeota archaeon]|nr:hypothetical protein [Candidatus Pacearchaeota archaeon]